MWKELWYHDDDEEFQIHQHSSFSVSALKLTVNPGSGDPPIPANIKICKHPMEFELYNNIKETYTNV